MCNNPLHPPLTLKSKNEQSTWRAGNRWIWVEAVPQERDQQDRAFGLHIPGLGEWGPIRRSQSAGTGGDWDKEDGKCGFSQMGKDLEHGTQGLRVCFYKASCSSLICSFSRPTQGSLHCSGTVLGASVPPSVMWGTQTCTRQMGCITCCPGFLWWL